MDKTDNSQDTSSETPGQLLRSQRKKVGLAIQDIAKQTRLDINIIEAIETDNQERLPSANYVRGYLRNYAKIVAADADKIIQLYNEKIPLTPPDIVPQIKTPIKMNNYEKPIKILIFLLIGCLVALFLWYQRDFITNLRLDFTNINHSNPVSRINGVDINYDIIIHDDSWRLATNDVAEEPVTTTTEHVETILDDTNQDTIVMQITSDSWVEIVDSNDKQIFFDLATANNLYTLKGKAPFSVLLGFADGVKLTLNGKPVDFQSSAKNNLARFSLSK